MVRRRLRPRRHPLHRGGPARPGACHARRLLRRRLADRDGGATWANTSQGMDAGAYMPPERRYDGNIQDVHRISACAARPDVLWAQHHCGMYRSTDGGLHWQEIPAPQPSGFGFAVQAHPVDPQTAWFVPAHSDAQRMPVDGRMVVTVTRDGAASFQAHGEGLPARDAYHLVYRHGLACAADGQTLALGSTTGWTVDQRGRRRAMGLRVARPAADRGGAVRVARQAPSAGPAARSPPSAYKGLRTSSRRPRRRWRRCPAGGAARSGRWPGPWS